MALDGRAAAEAGRDMASLIAVASAEKENMFIEKVAGLAAGLAGLPGAQFTKLPAIALQLDMRVERSRLAQGAYTPERTQMSSWLISILDILQQHSVKTAQAVLDQAKKSALHRNQDEITDARFLSELRSAVEENLAPLLANADSANGLAREITPAFFQLDLVAKIASLQSVQCDERLKSVGMGGLSALKIAIGLDGAVAQNAFKSLSEQLEILTAGEDITDEQEVAFTQAVADLAAALAGLPGAEQTKLSLMAYQLDMRAARTRVQKTQNSVLRRALGSRLLFLIDKVYAVDAAAAQGIFRQAKPYLQSEDDIDDITYSNKILSTCEKHLAGIMETSEEILVLYTDIMIATLNRNNDFEGVEACINSVVNTHPEVYASIKVRYVDALMRMIREASNISEADLPSPLQDPENCLYMQSNADVILEPWRNSLGFKSLRLRDEAYEKQRPAPRNPAENRNILFVSNSVWSFMGEMIKGFEEVEGLSIRTFDFSIAQNAYGLLPKDAALPAPDGTTAPMACSKQFQDGPFKALLDWADVVFVEWCDWSAVWMSNYIPEGKRLVVRLHSYEAFSTLPFFMNWSRVDGMVFVANHIRKFFNIQHGDRCATEQVVIDNIRDFSSFVSTGPQSRNCVLAMVGYNNANKNPSLALEILRALRNENPAWRLKLIGQPWGDDDKLSELEADYKKAFFEKISAWGLGEAIEFVDYVDQQRLNDCLREVGVIVSCSNREGTHEAIVEGIASGCVPLIRNWPTSARYNGAHSHFAPFSSFVFNTLDEAVAIARSHAAPTQDMRDALHRKALETYDQKATFPEIKSFILGVHADRTQ